MSNLRPQGIHTEISGGASRLLLFLYFLSGAISLAYEVLWSRMLSMQFGTSIFGVALTVTAYMIGLGLGSLAGAKWAQKWNRPLQIFAMLEIAIALYALILPRLIHAAGSGAEQMSAHLSLAQWYMLQGIEALGLLVIPAFAMGMGFALILRFVEQTDISLGELYGFNTIGGVAGALYPLWSLPIIGWTASVQTIALTGLLVGGGVLALAQRTMPATQTAASGKHIQPPLTILLIYAGIGAGSIMLEIGWIRLYGMVMLRTEYVLGLILAIFLLGIALGSLIQQRIKKEWMVEVMPLIAGAGVMLGLWLLPATSAWVEQSEFRSFFGAVASQALILGLFTLPITLVLGAWLPMLAVRYEGAGASGVWLYGANCLGGSVGAIAAFLVLIPLVGSTAMVALSSLFITAFGLMWMKRTWPWLLFALLPLFAWQLRNMPQVHELLPRIEAESRNLYLYEDAISLTHVVQQPDGQRVLLSDLQRMDASSDPSAAEIQMDQARLALLLHQEPRSVLFLGLGTGISAAGSMPFPGIIRSAVELSQGAIYSAKRWFSPVNGNITDQMQIQRDDARHYLGSSQRSYDVIVGDLFHPDMAGMGSLLSVQQFQRARDHLNPEGIFVQWLALNQFDIQSLNAVFRSFRQVFPDAQLFMDGMHLALVGPKDRFAGASAMLRNLSRMTPEAQQQATGGEGIWTWLGRYWGPVPETSGPVQDEWEPYIEFKLPRARYDGDVNLSSLIYWLLQHHSTPGAAMDILGVSERDKSQFGRAYVATEFTVRAWAASIQEDAAKSAKLIWLAYQANPKDHWIANALADSMMQSISLASKQGLSERDALLRILKVYPNHVAALRALWHLETAEGNLQAAEQYRSRLRAISPMDAEVKTASTQ